MKTCPECGSEWAPKFKFCPEDGTPLPAEAPAPKATFPATSPSQRPRAAQPATDRRLFDLEPVAPPEPAGKAPRTTKPRSAAFDRPEPARPEPARPQRLVRDASSRGEAPRTDAGPTMQNEPVSRVAPTALMDSIPPEMTSETRRQPRPEADEPVAVRARPSKSGSAARPAPKSAPAARPAPKSEPAKPEAPVAKPETSKKAKKNRDFSETAWFMRQPNPEEADPETGKVKVTKKAYAVEEPIPEEKRKKYSLRRSDED